jgi:hypothetical protein
VSGIQERDQAGAFPFAKYFGKGGSSTKMAAKVSKLALAVLWQGTQGSAANYIGPIVFEGV